MENEKNEELRKYQEIANQQSASTPPHSGCCPACGHCPHCGRGGYRTYTYPHQYPHGPWFGYTTPSFTSTTSNNLPAGTLWQS